MSFDVDFYKFEVVTLVPYEPQLIDVNMLTEQQVMLVIISIVKIEICHDFLPPSKRDSHGQITLTHSLNTHPLSHIPGTSVLILTSCASLTVYTNRIM